MRRAEGLRVGLNIHGGCRARQRAFQTSYSLAPRWCGFPPVRCYSGRATPPTAAIASRTDSSKLRWSNSGTERILAFQGPGAVVGELAIIDGQPRATSAVAVRDAVLSFLSRAAFEAFAEKHHPDFRL